MLIRHALTTPRPRLRQIYSICYPFGLADSCDGGGGVNRVRGALYRAAERGFWHLDGEFVGFFPATELPGSKGLSGWFVPFGHSNE
jgi:hypothetical protein